MPIVLNGKVYEWGDITMIAPWGVTFSIAELSYDHEVDVEPVLGNGRGPIGYGRGDWKGNGKISMIKEEYDLLLLSTAKNSKPGIYNMPPCNIILIYQKDDGMVPSTTTIKNLVFKKGGIKHAIGDKKILVDLEFEIISDVIENGISTRGEGFASPI